MDHEGAAVRVCFACEFDATDPDIYSGRFAPMLRQVERHFETIRAFPLDRSIRYLFLPAILAARSRGRPYNASREPIVVRSLARQVERVVRRERPDLIFGAHPRPVAALEPAGIPIVFFHDATFAILAETYPGFAGDPPRLIAEANRQHQRLLARCSAAIYTSRWAADSAIRHYGADPGKLHVIPFGANVEPLDASELGSLIAARQANGVRILFVGREWERKGGGIVLETAQILRAGGLEVQLDVVGPSALPVPAPAYARLRGTLSHKDPADKARLHELFRAATLVFVPSRAEAFGMIFCEAAAFGLPAVTTAVGGIPEVVRDGVTGLVLPLEAGPDAYAAAIAGLVADPARYGEMAGRARAEYEARLSWDVIGAQLRNLLVSVVERRGQRP